MSQLNAEVLHILQRQKNIIAIRQLTESGVARAARDRLVRHGVLVPVERSVLAVPGGVWTLERRSIVLSLQHPQGYISGPTAGRLLHVRRMPRLADIRLVVPHGSKIDVPPGVDSVRRPSCRPNTSVASTTASRSPTGLGSPSTWRPT